ncbi:MAG: cytochrome b562 [Planctomycetota bacterium]|nr:cytochrome b562 [Planctomycetota bacterium]
MKSSTRLVVLAPLALSALAVPAFLSPPRVAPQAAVPEAKEGPLEEAMQALQAGVKGLDKALEKKEVDKALGLVVGMQKAAHEAKLGTPEKAGEITDEKEKAKFLTGYRLKLIELERGLLDVEVALVEGKVDEAKKALEAKVKPVKKAGHDVYKDGK